MCVVVIAFSLHHALAIYECKHSVNVNCCARRGVARNRQVDARRAAVNAPEHSGNVAAALVYRFWTSSGLSTDYSFGLERKGC